MGKGGGSSSSTVTVNSDDHVAIVGLDNIHVEAKIDPLTTDSKLQLVLPQPFATKSEVDTNSTSKSDSTVNTDSKVSSDSRNALSVDLKPVAVDLCLNTSSKLPHGQIHQPFSYHVGWTMFGVEMFGVTFGGESRVILEDLPKKPAVDWPAQQNAPSPGKAPCEAGSSPALHERGLRIRVK